jgi:hypothetical protein
MDCLPVPKLPEGAEWIWEVKLDGYRAVAVKSGDAVTLIIHTGATQNASSEFVLTFLRREMA